MTKEKYAELKKNYLKFHCERVHTAHLSHSFPLAQINVQNHFPYIVPARLNHGLLEHRIETTQKSSQSLWDTSYLANMPSPVLVEGTSELRNWIITAAVAGKGITMIDYVPCYRTLKGVGCAMGFGYWK